MRLLAVALCVLLSAGSVDAQDISSRSTRGISLDEAACGRLVGLAIPADAIGLPTGGGVVTGSESVTSGLVEGRPVEAHCLVSGRIGPIDPEAPDILFRVALPTQWNGKAVMLGGGGFSGSIPDVAGNLLNTTPTAASPLARGYAVFGSDSGHQVDPTRPGVFLLNEEAHLNWRGDALKKTRDSAVAIITAAYGGPPTTAYFLGGSTGGREALIVAGRWPQDWDGVVSLYGARNLIAEVLGGQRINRALAAPGAFLNPAKRGVLFHAALEACDERDGLSDGVISDVHGCNSVFVPATATLKGRPVRCPNGADSGDHCLSDAQLALIDVYHRPFDIPFPLESGERRFPGFNILTSDTGIPNESPLQPMVSWTALGAEPPGFPATAGMSLSTQFGDNFIRYGFAKDVDFNPLEFDPSNPGALQSRVSEMSRPDTADHDLSAFHAKGGKVIILHGTADMIVSPRLMEDYHAELTSRMGADTLASFLQFYQVPGFGHAFSTNFSAAWDWLGAIEGWVEEGARPGDEQVVMDVVGEPGRTRPLCAYPGWPRYRGSGDPTLASSFDCAGS